jgi:hypothetical protein
MASMSCVADAFPARPVLLSKSDWMLLHPPDAGPWRPRHRNRLIYVAAGYWLANWCASLLHASHTMTDDVCGDRQHLDAPRLWHARLAARRHEEHAYLVPCPLHLPWCCRSGQLACNPFRTKATSVHLVSTRTTTRLWDTVSNVLPMAPWAMAINSASCVYNCIVYLAAWFRASKLDTHGNHQSILLICAWLEAQASEGLIRIQEVSQLLVSSR